MTLVWLAIGLGLVHLAQGDLDCLCQINTRGEIKTYDNTHLLIYPETMQKSLLSRWDEVNTDTCKFRLRGVPENGRIKWVAMSVGVHKNSKKFWRNFAFDRFQPRRVEIRGWKALRDIEDHEIPFQFIGGDTEATLYGDYDNGYIINSTTCPGFEFRYTPLAPSDEPEIQLAIDSAIYQTPADKLRGWCQNCNGDKTDDYRLCSTLVSVAEDVNAMEQISGSCVENDKNPITV